MGQRNLTLPLPYDSTDIKGKKRKGVNATKVKKMKPENKIQKTALLNLAVLKGKFHSKNIRASQGNSPIPASNNTHDS